MPGREQLQRMTDVMAHRGPDAGATIILGDGQVAFGHRRLSIVNVGGEADQPMISAETGVAIVYNGEIYNHRALREELVAAGCIFHTRNSDTEVLLKGYETWGLDGILHKLVGMFAFAIWDPRTRKLLCGRDRLGIKPLYYALVEGCLVLASEAKAITLFPGFTIRMNDRACTDILNVLATPAPQTMFDGVFKLGPGETLVASVDGHIEKQRYWGPPTEPRQVKIDENEAVEEVRRLATNAARIRIADEVENCIFLSGGVDSGFLLGAAAQGGARLRAMTAAYTNDPLNESTEAAEIAERFGCPHEIVEVDEKLAMSALLHLMSGMDEPIADWACIPLQFLSAHARAAGVKVALVGEGADELFCGYSAWRDFIHESALWRNLASASRFGASGALAILTRTAAAAAPLTRFGFVGAMDVATSVMAGHGRFRSGAESMRPAQIMRILKPNWKPSPTTIDPATKPGPLQTLEEQLAHASAGYPDSLRTAEELFRNMRRRDLGFRLPELLLMRVDKITMASSIEARVPFLDHRLVEFVLGLPEKLVLGEGGSKPLLKKAAMGLLPDETLNRKKIGLGAPMEKWLRTDFGDQVADLLSDETRDPESPFSAAAVRSLFQRHRSGEKDYSSYLWPIISIALWRKKWLRADHAISN